MNIDAPEGQYLYCFFRASEPETFQSKGMDGRGEPVASIHYRDLGVVLSTSSLDHYDSRRWNMMTHTHVLEEVMERYPILPVRFNTIAQNKDKVYELLRRRYDELNGLLDEITGKVEMGLKAFWYEGAAFDEILTEYPDIRSLRDSLQKRSIEETYYERIRLGEMVDRALTQKRKEQEFAILKTLRPYVHRTQVNQVITDRMIINVAFLVQRTKEGELEAAVQALDAQMGRGILFRYAGPVPPYNFVNLVISWNNSP